jgi:hypothetical protein
MKEQDLLKLEGVAKWLEGEIDFYDMPVLTRDALYDFYQTEMPYGVQKARTGDPDTWILNRLERLVA